MESADIDTILSAMVEGVMVVNSTGRVTRANPAIRDMFHWPWPIEGRHYLEVVRQPDIAAQFADALAGRSCTGVEIELERDARRTYTARAMPMPVDRGGGALLVLHDITELKQTDRVRRDFVANVSHELRTPLTAIRGYIEVLADEGASPEARRFLGIIARHTARMERLVSDLLRLARLDAGQEALTVMHVSLEAIVTGVETEMQEALARQRHTVRRDFGEGAAEVDADQAKLHDVLRNLIENATHYAPADSPIDITSRRIGDAVTITVADRGPGIPAKDLPRVFERFYRADRSRTTDPGGSGLGLAIVKHLVELHGGHAEAHQRDGGGAEVSITLPLVRRD